MQCSVWAYRMRSPQPTTNTALRTYLIYVCGSISWCQLNFWFDYLWLLLSSPAVAWVCRTVLFVASLHCFIEHFDNLLVFWSIRRLFLSSTFPSGKGNGAGFPLEDCRHGNRSVPTASKLHQTQILRLGKVSRNVRVKTEMKINGNCDVWMVFSRRHVSCVVSECVFARTHERRNKFGNDLLESCNFARRQQHANVGASCQRASKHCGALCAHVKGNLHSVETKIA